MQFNKNRICNLFSIDFPIIQAGMIWTSGWRLASAVSNAGGLGLIGAGSMYPEILREHIQKCKKATDKPFGVNVPLLYPDIDKIIQILIEENVNIVFTSAGNPSTWTKTLKDKGMKVAHVVSSVKFAKKAEQAGVDAVVAEGFEAGGHNGREETTTMVLIPMVRDAVSIPLLAAGGIADGRAMLAAERDANSWINKIEKQWSGALPATIIINQKTGQRKFIEKELHEGDLERLIEELK